MTFSVPFVDRVVRDLWWAVMSPGLVAEGYCSTVPQVDPARWLGAFGALDGAPGALHEVVAGSLGGERLRLGAYFEDLVGFFVRHMAGHREVEEGIVIAENRRTVGELDLVFRGPESCQHWELAVKFYLQVPGLAQEPGECFVGPETRDRLHLKLARLRDHQLPLAGRPVAAESLARWGPLSSAALVRGRLFYPASSDWEAGEAGESVHGGHGRGWWCHVDQVRDLVPAAHAYAVLTRRDWFAPVGAGVDHVTPLTLKQLIAWADGAASDWTEGIARSQVVACLDAAGGEVHRGFLVSVGWPGLARAGAGS